jgi:hypothetical protein
MAPGRVALRTMLTTSHLSIAALGFVALAAAATFLDWAVPRVSAAELLIESQRLRAAGEEIPAGQAAKARVAFGLSGTDAPFHGTAVLVLVMAGGVLIAIGASTAKQPERVQVAETELRAGGGVLALAFLVLLLDCSSEVFSARARGAGLWAALALTIAGALAATFASAQVRPEEEAMPERPDLPDSP